MATNSLRKSSAAMTFARVEAAGASSGAASNPAGFDGVNRDHYFLEMNNYLSLRAFVFGRGPSFVRFRIFLVGMRGATFRPYAVKRGCRSVAKGVRAC
jgi:hypothetical protein